MSSRVIQPAPVRKHITVQADVQECFAAFTDGIGSWWPRSKSIGTPPQKTVVLEPHVGGRWYELAEDGSECEWGKVLEWQPPSRVILAWQIDTQWKFDPTLVTEVEINFTPLGNGATRVDIEHRKLERLGDDAAKARAAFDSDNGWAGILKQFAGAQEI